MYICMNQKGYLYGVIFSPWEVDQIGNKRISFIIFSLCNIILENVNEIIHIRELNVFVVKEPNLILRK